MESLGESGRQGDLLGDFLMFFSWWIFVEGGKKTWKNGSESRSVMKCKFEF